MSAPAVIGIGLLCAANSSAAVEVTRLSSDEQIIFYPSIAQREAGIDAWRIEIRGCVFEPEKRRMMVAALREALELKNVEMSPQEQKVFNERARLFLVDHERGKRIFVRFGDEVFAVGKSRADGNFSGTVVLSDAEADKLRNPVAGGGSQIFFQAALSPGDARAFPGEVALIENTGRSVISDIDDTIKITEVRDRQATLRNTFLREFQPVPGMAEFYQSLAGSNRAEFHYVSASPWQLYEPLSDFLHVNGFPAGVFALKEFRWKNKTFLSLFADPEKYKTAAIEPLLRRFPNRHFVLIGDSGERDPEIYAALARRYPQQIERIIIRDVTGEPAGAQRYGKVFRDLPPELWQVFTAPAELAAWLEGSAHAH